VSYTAPPDVDISFAPLPPQVPLFYQVIVRDRDAYEAQLESLFSISETPTVVQKSAPLAHPMPNEESEKRSLLSYLASARGKECALLTYGYVVGRDGNLFECDAWDNQYGMTYDFPTYREDYVPDADIDDTWFTTSNASYNLSELSSHLGPNSLSIRKSGEPHRVTGNTRFVVTQLGSNAVYRPVTLPSVKEALEGYLSKVPNRYLQSLVHALVQYRCAIKVVYNESKFVSMRAKDKSATSTSTLGEICSVLLDWGANRRFVKLGNAMFQSERFGRSGASGISDSMDKKMMLADGKITKEILATVLDSPLRPNQPMGASVWKGAILTRPVDFLLGRDMYPDISDRVYTLSRLIDREEAASFTPYKGSSRLLTKSVEKTSSVFRSDINREVQNRRIVNVSSAGVQRFPVLKRREVREYNLVDISEQDAIVTRPGERVKLVRTPFFIKQVVTGRGFGHGKKRIDITNKVQMCYIVWEDGAVIKFQGLDISLRWGYNLRLSSLFTNKIFTTVVYRSDGNRTQTYNVFTLRKMPINSLDIIRAL